MAYPILAASSTWWKPNVSSVTRASITEIEIMDSYTPDSSVTVVDSWDASAAQDGSITCYVIGTKLIMAGNGSGKIEMNEDSSSLFFGYRKFNYSTFTYDEDVFENVADVKNLNLLFCNNVTTLSWAFAYLRNLKSLDLSTWNTGKVTNISFLVIDCLKLESLNVQNWITQQFVNISCMFRFSECLEEVVGLDSWELPNLEECWGCFDHMPFTTLDLTKWNVSKVKNFSFMVSDMPNLEEVDISNWDTSNATASKGMFARNPSLVNISFPNNFKLAGSAADLFISCKKIEEIDTSNWDTAFVTGMDYAFYNCLNLRNLDVSKWDVSNVTTFRSMFEICSNISNIDVSNWDTSSCTDMSFMFWGASSIGEIDVSNWDVSKVTTLDHFAAHAGLRRKGIENWNTSSLVNANAAFHNCAEEELDLSGWDVSKVQFFCQMFENSPNLKRIKGLEKWDTSAGLGFDEMFERCYVLEELDLSSFDTSKAKNGVTCSGNDSTTATLNNMFLSCNNLRKITLGSNFAVNGDGTNTTAANKLILPTPSTDYIEGADGNWYAFNGDSYAPNAIPDRTAQTYFASFPLCQDQDVIIKNGSLIDTAKAIREKNGATTQYTPSEFGTAIRAL